MKELKRVLFNKVWLGMAALLLVCNCSFFYFNQSARLNSSVSEYNEANASWYAQLSSISTEEGLRQLEQAQNNDLLWFIVESTLSSIEDGTADESALEQLKEEYPNIDEIVRKIKSGQLLTENIGDRVAVERWMQRLTYRAEYQNNVEAIVDQSNKIHSNPLFSEPDSFSYRNAEKTAEDFMLIKNEPLYFHPFDSVESVIENNGNLLFSICAVFAAVILILAPNHLGMDIMEKSCKNGRTVLALWRCMTLFVASLLSALVMIGSLFLSAMAIYHQDIPLSAPVQSMAFFQNWTEHTSVAQFIVWMIGLRAIGLFILGLLFWMLLSRFRSVPAGVIVTASLLAVEYHWYSIYHLNDLYYPLAAVNIFQLLSVEKIAGRYLNYDIFGALVNEHRIIPAIMLLLLSFLVISFLLYSHFGKGAHHQTRLHTLFEKCMIKLRTYQQPKPLWLYECKKAMVFSGGMVLLLLGAFALILFDAPAVNSKSSDMMLTQYVRQYEGSVSDETYQQILGEKEKADMEYVEMAESESALGNLTYYQIKCEATANLADRYSALLEMKNSGEDHIALVNEVPLERIYGETGTYYRFKSTAVVILVICLFVPCLFWIERKNGLNNLILTTRNGRSKLWKDKIVIAFAVSISLWILWTVKELQLLNSIGINWSMLYASGHSLFYWSDLGDHPLYLYLLVHYTLRFIGVLAAAGTSLAISNLLSSILSAGGLMVAALLIPGFLSLSGSDWITSLAWSSQLAGTELAITSIDLIWLILWAVFGIVGALFSSYLWRRYHS